jgi:hypothetical protein
MWKMRAAGSAILNLESILSMCSSFAFTGVTVCVRENSNKKIRVFPLLPRNMPQPRLRTNETYDACMGIALSERATNKLELRDQMRGQISECVFRDLTYFDVGKSFVSDSLHNIYHGVMVSTALKEKTDTEKDVHPQFFSSTCHD